MDPFHVVQWMNDALDAVRCEEWNAARAAARAGPRFSECKKDLCDCVCVRRCFLTYDYFVKFS